MALVNDGTTSDGTVTEVDAVLVGGSAGSLLAALLLEEAGATVVIIEKTNLVGGGTAYSGGSVWAPANSRMRAKGLADSVEAGLEYLHQIGGSSWDRASATTYLTSLPEVMDSVARRTGLQWVTYAGLPDYFAELSDGRAEGRVLLPLPASKSPELLARLSASGAANMVRRGLHSPGLEDEWIAGRLLVGALWAAVNEKGIDWRFNREVVDVQPHDGHAATVLARGTDGQEVYRARLGVLLNTGGFEWDEELTARFVGEPLPAPQTPPGNTGDGQRLAHKLGAPLTLLDRTIGIPAVKVKQPTNDGRVLYRLFFQPLAKPHSVVINGQGQRFANETFFPELAEAWRRTDHTGRLVNVPMFFVFDHQYLAGYGMPAGLADVDQLYEAGSISDLEQQLYLPTGSLSTTLEDYNNQIELGRPDGFGRGSTAYQRAFGDVNSEAGGATRGSIRVPPFYAAQLHPSTSGHRGGVTVDQDGRVLDGDGTAIAALYACGNVVAGTATGDAYISGASIGHALVFGYRAARAMIASSRYQVH